MSLTSIVTLRRLAMFSISASTSAAAAARVASSAARMSSDNSQRPGPDPRLVEDSGPALAARVRTLQDAHVEAAGDGAAADIMRGKPHALLFGKADHLEMEGQPPSTAIEVLDRHEAGQDAEPAV